MRRADDMLREGRYDKTNVSISYSTDAACIARFGQSLALMRARTGEVDSAICERAGSPFELIAHARALGLGVGLALGEIVFKDTPSILRRIRNRPSMNLHAKPSSIRWPQTTIVF